MFEMTILKAKFYSGQLVIIIGTLKLFFDDFTGSITLLSEGQFSMNDDRKASLI